MKYLNGNILCLEGLEFIRTEFNLNGLVPEGTYKSLQFKKKIIVHGRGGNGRQVLIEYETLPDAYKLLVQAKYGNPYEYMAKQPLRDLIQPDAKAIDFFENYRKPDGLPLKSENRIEYANNAAILNAINILLTDKKKLKRDYKISLDQFWNTAGILVKEVRDRFPNTLPTSERRLKPVYKQYKKDGYIALISGKIGNSNGKKVNQLLERLLLSLYAKGKPYAKEVHANYMRFIAGELEVADIDTGELFSPEQFYKDGRPIEISDTTVWAYINKPYNRLTVDKIRTGSLEYNNSHTPHNHRHSPLYAFSKISMDDLELPFKMPNGDRVKCYQIIDVASGCIVGKAFGTDKNRGLFMEAVIDMFRLIINKGWGIPAEIEVEQHIANTFSDDLLKQGVVFPFVRFCRPRNPQEKRAEHIFRRKKYDLQKKRSGFQGRWYGRQEATRPNEDTNTLQLSYEDIVANELHDLHEWNNQKHPNQVLFPGLTRWQVLCERQNPEIILPNIGLIARYIGHKTPTTIWRNQYVQVKYAKYQLPHPSYIKRLHNYNVNAYYLPDADGLITEVHIYQKDQFICTCKKIQPYNEAQVEMNETDRAIMQEQFKYRKQFDSMVKDSVSKLANVKVYDKAGIKLLIEQADTPPLAPVTSSTENEPETTPPDFDFDPDYWKEKAKQDL